MRDARVSQDALQIVLPQGAALPSVMVIVAKIHSKSGIEVGRQRRFGRRGPDQPEQANQSRKSSQFGNDGQQCRTPAEVP